MLRHQLYYWVLPNDHQWAPHLIDWITAIPLYLPLYNAVVYRLWCLVMSTWMHYLLRHALCYLTQIYFPQGVVLIWLLNRQRFMYMYYETGKKEDKAICIPHFLQLFPTQYTYRQICWHSFPSLYPTKAITNSSFHLLPCKYFIAGTRFFRLK